MARALGRELFFVFFNLSRACCMPCYVVHLSLQPNAVFLFKHYLQYFIMKTLTQKAKATFILSRFGFFVFFKLTLEGKWRVNTHLKGKGYQFQAVVCVIDKAGQEVYLRDRTQRLMSPKRNPSAGLYMDISFQLFGVNAKQSDCWIILLPQWFSVKESACDVGDREDIGSIPGSGRSPEEGFATHFSVLA